MLSNLYWLYSLRPPKREKFIKIWLFCHPYNIFEISKINYLQLNLQTNFAFSFSFYFWIMCSWTPLCKHGQCGYCLFPALTPRRELDLPHPNNFFCQTISQHQHSQIDLKPSCEFKCVRCLKISLKIRQIWTMLEPWRQPYKNSEPFWERKIRVKFLKQAPDSQIFWSTLPHKFFIL